MERRKDRNRSIKGILRIVCITLVMGLTFVENGIYFDSSDVQQVYAAEKVSLNKKKATLYVGKTLQLTLNGASGKVTWASSKTKVAKVSSTGKVTAVSPGTARITAAAADGSGRTAVALMFLGAEAVKLAEPVVASAEID